MHFELSTYYYGNEFQDDLRKNLKVVLEKYSCSEILMPVFTCVNELVVNAVKANYKKIFFEKNRQSYGSNVKNYEDVLSCFRHEFSSERINNLTKLAISQNLKTNVECLVDGSVLQIRVINPLTATVIERENIKRKLKAAKETTEMIDYFANEINDKAKEGAGLGIIFIGIILNSLGISIDNLSIKSLDGKTIATLAIPLTSQVVDQFKLNSQAD